METQRPRRFYLKEWREHRGLSQSELARRIATTSSRISEVESGVERYNETLLQRLADALECDIADLVLGPPETLSEARLALHRLDPDQMRVAAQVLRALADSQPSATFEQEPPPAPVKKRRKHKG
jgi:transcriptional regulator with XRE-family HTH domain